MCGQSKLNKATAHLRVIATPTKKIKKNGEETQLYRIFKMR